MLTEVELNRITLNEGETLVFTITDWQLSHATIVRITKDLSRRFGDRAILAYLPKGSLKIEKVIED